MNNTLNIDNCIKELLFEHDCVIVPDFGGFVAIYKSAELNKKRNILHPPSKMVSFNTKLKNNDGLLANHLAHNSSLSYNNAMHFVKEKVADYKKVLSEKRRLEIGGVGVLYIDQSGNYKFTPKEENNYLKSSFGLQKIYIKPLLVEEPTQVEVEKIEVPRKKKWIAAAVVVPLFLAGAYWLGTSLDKNQFNLANINPFQNKEIQADYSPSEVNSSQSIETSEEKSLADWIKEYKDQESFKYSFSESMPSDSGIEIQLKEKEAKVPLKHVEHQMDATGYYVVGGAFKEISNANNMVKKLRALGYDSFLFHKKGNLNMVCYGHYTDKAEARKMLKQVKSKENRSAWLKKL